MAARSKDLSVRLIPDPSVIPAKAVTQRWVPAFAGMTTLPRSRADVSKLPLSGISVKTEKEAPDALMMTPVVFPAESGNPGWVPAFATHSRG